jgi:hypothetical protein
MGGGQPGPGIAEHELVAQVTAPPGVLPLERLQPAATEAVSQRDHQPLLGRGELGDQPSQLAELSLVNVCRPVRARASFALPPVLGPVRILDWW